MIFYPNLAQGSPQWLQWRREGVTATDSVVLLGASPHKSAYGLWLEKTGRREPENLSGNPNVRRGHQLEETARTAWESRHHRVVRPNCALYDADPCFRASFDGLTTDGMPLELKCPGDKVFAEVCTQGLSSPTVQMYRIQVMHQILVAEAKEAVLCFWHEGEMKEFTIARDEALIARILAAGRSFQNCVEANVPPEQDPALDPYEPQGAAADQWRLNAKIWLALNERLARLTAEVTLVKEAMKTPEDNFKSLMGVFKRGESGGVAVTRADGARRINWQACAVKLNGGVKPDESVTADCQSTGAERWIFRPTDSV